MRFPKMRPRDDEYSTFYRGYVDLVPEDDVLPALSDQLAILRRLKSAVAPGREKHAYAPGKWTIRQLAGHLGDGERVFGFRALAFSRRDATPLPGFDENTYVANARSNERTLADLTDELSLQREANLRLFASLDEAQWSCVGTANENPVSVRALAYIMTGHVRHHVAILRERYGVSLD